MADDRQQIIVEVMAEIQRFSSDIQSAADAMDKAFKGAADQVKGHLDGMKDQLSRFGTEAGHMGMEAGKAFGEGMAEIALVAITGMLVEFKAKLDEAVQYAHKLEVLHIETGSSIENLQKMIGVWAAAGVTAERANQQFMMFGANIKKAQDAKPGTSVFERAGLDPKSMGKDLVRDVDAVADAFKRLDATGRDTLAKAAFGRSASELSLILGQGKAGIDATAASMAKLGVIMSGDTIKKLDDFHKRITLLGLQLVTLAGSFGGSLLSAITKFLDSLTPVIVALEKLPDAAKLELVFGSVAAAAILAGGAIAKLGTVFPVIGALASAFGPFAAVLGGIIAAVIAFGIAWTTNFAGIQQALAPAIDMLQKLWQMLVVVGKELIHDLKPAWDLLYDAITRVTAQFGAALSAFNKNKEAGDALRYVLEHIKNWIVVLITAIVGIISALSHWSKAVGYVIDQIANLESALAGSLKTMSQWAEGAQKVLGTFGPNAASTLAGATSGWMSDRSKEIDAQATLDHAKAKWFYNFDLSKPKLPGAEKPKAGGGAPEDPLGMAALADKPGKEKHKKAKDMTGEYIRQEIELLKERIEAAKTAVDVAAEAVKRLEIQIKDLGTISTVEELAVAQKLYTKEIAATNVEVKAQQGLVAVLHQGSQQMLHKALQQKNPKNLREYMQEYRTLHQEEMKGETTILELKSKAHDLEAKSLAEAATLYKSFADDATLSTEERVAAERKYLAVLVQQGETLNKRHAAEQEILKLQADKQKDISGDTTRSYEERLAALNAELAITQQMPHALTQVHALQQQITNLVKERADYEAQMVALGIQGGIDRIQTGITQRNATPIGSDATGQLQQQRDIANAVDQRRISEARLLEATNAQMQAQQNLTRVLMDSPGDNQAVNAAQVALTQSGNQLKNAEDQLTTSTLQEKVAREQTSVAVTAMRSGFAQLAQQASPELAQAFNLISTGMNPIVAIFLALFSKSKAFHDIMVILGRIVAAVAQVFDALRPIIDFLLGVLVGVVNVFLMIYNVIASILNIFGLHLQKIKLVNTALDDMADAAKKTIAPLVAITHDLPTFNEYNKGKWDDLVAKQDDANKTANNTNDILDQGFSQSLSSFGQMIGLLLGIQLILKMTGIMGGGAGSSIIGRLMGGLFGKKGGGGGGGGIFDSSNIGGADWGTGGGGGGIFDSSNIGGADWGSAGTNYGNSGSDIVSSLQQGQLFAYDAMGLGNSTDWATTFGDGMDSSLSGSAMSVMPDLQGETNNLLTGLPSLIGSAVGSSGGGGGGGGIMGAIGGIAHSGILGGFGSIISSVLPFVGIATAIFGMFGHKDNPALMPDKYSPGFGQTMANLAGSGSHPGDQPFSANGQAYFEDAGMLSKLGGKGILQYIASYIQDQGGKGLDQNLIQEFTGVGGFLYKAGGMLQLQNGITENWQTVVQDSTKAMQQIATAMNGAAQAVNGFTNGLMSFNLADTFGNGQNFYSTRQITASNTWNIQADISATPDPAVMQAQFQTVFANIMTQYGRTQNYQLGTQQYVSGNLF